ncbi:RNA-directed DNA polymerase [Gammaproteobacteria bacterium]
MSRNWDKVVRLDTITQSINVDGIKTTVTEFGNTWKTAPWKRYRTIVFRLQKRIHEAEKIGNKDKVRYLQKLLLKSFAARMLAVRQVTQLNAGKKTAGVDGKASLTNKERMELVEQLKDAKKWKHQGLRSVMIPKKNGKMKELKIPTIADRAWQCLCKLAIEPAHEAHFHAKSYGFRPGRSAHDAQKIIFNNLKSDRGGKDKRILELDIEKCFDRISHSSILERVIAPQAIKQGLSRCLKAGVNPEFPEQGTPQGGVISPLLANVALNGIEDIHPSVRYADDMVVFLKPNDDAEAVLGKIKTFLADRMMKVSEAKTKLTSILDGFDFLGWRFYVQKNNGKFRSEPSEANYQAFRTKVKDVILNLSFKSWDKSTKVGTNS